MDPNATLTLLRQAVGRLSTATTQNELLDIIEEVQDAFENLDEWLSKGGFLPDAWRGQR